MRIGFPGALGLICLLALVLRVALVLATPHFATIDDSHSYDRMAVSLADHGTLPSSQIPLAGGPTAYPPPGYPYTLALAYLIAGTGSAHSRWEAGRLEEAVLGTIAVLLLGLIAARVFGRRAGLLSAGIAAIYPPLVLVGSSLMSESVFIPLVLGAVLAALRARDPERHPGRWAALAGVLVALASLTRSNGIVLIIPICFLVWTERPRRSWRAARTPLVAIAAAVVALTPWAVRNTIEFHEFVPVSTETGYALAGTFNAVAQYDHTYPALWTPPGIEIYSYLKAHPRANEAQIGDDLVTFARRYIAAHPTYPFVVAYWSAVRLFNLAGPGYERYSATFEGYPPRLAYWSAIAFYVLALVALAGVAAGGLRRAPWALWGVPLVIVLSTLFFAGLTRYRAPADPFFIMLAAVGLLAAAERLRGRRVASAPA